MEGNSTMTQNELDYIIIEYSFPRKGQLYYNRVLETVVEAVENMTEKALIVERRAK